MYLYLFGAKETAYIQSTIQFFLSFSVFAVLPQCRSDQRLTYGATRKNSAGVSCFVEANPYPHNFRWQIQPNKKKGRTKHAETVDIPSDDFTLEHDHSVLQV